MLTSCGTPQQHACEDDCRQEEEHLAHVFRTGEAWRLVQRVVEGVWAGERQKRHQRDVHTRSTAPVPRPAPAPRPLRRTRSPRRWRDARCTAARPRSGAGAHPESSRTSDAAPPSPRSRWRAAAPRAPPSRPRTQLETRSCMGSTVRKSWTGQPVHSVIDGGRPLCSSSWSCPLAARAVKPVCRLPFATPLRPDSCLAARGCPRRGRWQPSWDGRGQLWSAPMSSSSPKASSSPTQGRVPRLDCARPVGSDRRVRGPDAPLPRRLPARRARSCVVSRVAWLTSVRHAVNGATDDLFGYGDPRGVRELRVALASYLGGREQCAPIPTRSSSSADSPKLFRSSPRHFESSDGRPSPSRIPRSPSIPSSASAPVSRSSECPSTTTGCRSTGLAQVPPRRVGHPRPPIPARSRDGARASGRPRRVGARRDGWIIEDDYDGEFRFDRQPVGALQGLDPSRVIYGGTASKSLAAGLHLAWLVLPPSLVEPVTETIRWRVGVSSIEQAALADFITRGQLDRHLRQMRLIYRRRRDSLLSALFTHAPWMTMTGASAGLHGTILLEGTAEREYEILRLAERASVGMHPLTAHRHTPGQPGLVVGYSRPAAHEFSSRRCSAGSARVGTPWSGRLRSLASSDASCSRTAVSSATTSPLAAGTVTSPASTAAASSSCRRPEEARERARDDAERRDAGDHQEDAGDPPVLCLRHDVAVADRRERDDAPPRGNRQRWRSRGSSGAPRCTPPTTRTAASPRRLCRPVRVAARSSAPKATQPRCEAAERRRASCRISVLCSPGMRNHGAVRITTTRSKMPVPVRR